MSTFVPLGYLLEALALEGLLLGALLWELHRGTPRFDLLWTSVGALAALSVLGMWSVGSIVAAGLLLGGTAALLAATRCPGSLGRPAPWLILGFAGQIALMASVIMIITGGALLP